MTTHAESGDALSASKRVLLALHEATTKLKAIDQEKNEPIAIVGMSCRFPGANSPEAFWQLLHSGMDAITEIPKTRWDSAAYYDPDPDAAGKLYVREGGFLDQVDLFDPQFFRITPHEAIYMDPQQRLLLEVSWEALERAGQRLESDTGVFIGITSQDYWQLINDSAQAESNFYATTGNLLNAAAGRLSYTFGFTGPSMAIDTACSSSLVAIHLACQSLRTRECRQALAGGVNLLLSPRGAIYLSRGRLLSPDGRCKAFAASANGMVRGEGCGMILLKRLSNALADGDPILALIRSSAVNQDGASSGLTVPNGIAQEALLRQALAKARLDPAELDYVEAHGTGTILGDPIEVNALAAMRTAGPPLLIGSVKSNIGHLEAAAGVAGLIKTVLAMQHAEIPPSLHCAQLNPHIDWDALPVRVVTEGMPWPDGGPERLAGVSAFGLSGTNAHIILEAAPTDLRLANDDLRVESLERPLHLLTLSAKSEPALKALAGRFQDFLTSRPDIALADICYTANTARIHFAHRLSLSATTTVQLQAQLSAYGEGQLASGVSQGYAPEHQAPPKVAFLFTGQGAQYVNMGRELYATQPIFRQALDQCDSLLQPLLGTSLLALLYPKSSVTAAITVSAHDDTSMLDETRYTEPALFALEYALATLWRSWGIEPAFVLGHSVGEYVAAYVAGVFSLEDALILVAARGRLMQEFTQPEAMEAMLAAFRQVAERIRYAAPRLPLVSTLTGQLAGAELATPEYWVRQVRKPVRFADGITTLHTLDVESYLEIGPKPILISLGQQSVAASLSATSTPQRQWLPSLRPGQPEYQQMVASLGQLYTQGVTVDWAGFENGTVRRKVVLPTYPFQRQRYWIETAAPPKAQRAGSLPPPASSEPPLNQQDSDLIYTIEWRAKPLPREPEKSLQSLSATADRWLIFGQPDGIGEALAAQLQAEGAQVIFVVAGQNNAAIQANKATGEMARLIVNLAAPEHFRQLLAEALRADVDAGSTFRHQPARIGVVYLWGAEPEASEGANAPALAEHLCGGVLLTVQVLVQAGLNTKLWLVTQGCQAVDQPETTLLPMPHDRLVVATASQMMAQGALWGLGRTIMVELPEMNCVCVDLDNSRSNLNGQLLLAELRANDLENQVAFRLGKRHIARLAHWQGADLPANGTPNEKPRVRDSGCYLITGGLGALGLQIAQQLVAEGARHLVLATRRSALPDGIQRTIALLEEAGASIQVVQADVTSQQEVVRLLAACAEQAPLRGIIHAAGVLDDGVLARQSLDRFVKAMAPKVWGAWHLHTLTQELSLDFFVCFSSMVAWVGSPGQGNYAAANAFMDGLVYQRRLQGLPALNINWGPWDEAGMVAQTTEQAHRHWKTEGVTLMHPQQARRIFSQLLRQQVVQVGVVLIDWSDLFRAHGNVPPFLTTFSKPMQTLPTASSEIAEQLKTIAVHERHRFLKTYLCRQITEVMGLREIDTQQPLIMLGLDSLMALKLRHQIQRTLAVDVPIAKFLEDVSIEGLSHSINEQLLSPAANSGLANSRVTNLGDKTGTSTQAFENLPDASMIAPGELMEVML